jgi:DNA-binding LytR/AlgR family response regulator
MLRPDQIELIESHGNYVELHKGDMQYISRHSLQWPAVGLAASGFARIKHSLLVDVLAISLRAARGTRHIHLHAILGGGRALEHRISQRDTAVGAFRSRPSTQ